MLKSIVLVILLITVAGSAIVAVGETASPIQSNELSAAASADGVTIFYLPLITQSDHFSSVGIPIWLDDSEISTHEIGLFRRNFVLKQTTKAVELRIFADTRYEIFLDGVWIGRGPARFSAVRREYDIHSIGDLQSGEHLISVLVQWAPNSRRSESQMPLLHAHLQSTSGSPGVLVATDDTWKALRSDAWNSDAVSVHSWGLIGPTELLDLQKLPRNWMLPTYDDRVWSNSVPATAQSVYSPFILPRLDSQLYVSLEPFSIASNFEIVNSVNTPLYQSRTIEPLENFPITATLRETGSLSPGRKIIELSGNEATYKLEFNVSDSLPFYVEGLASENTELLENIKLDEKSLIFETAGELRPDVVIASRVITPGQHTLTMDGIPSDGTTLTISTDFIEYHDLLPFSQGAHAGRRLLLAEFITSTTSIDTAVGKQLNFSLSPNRYAVIDLGRTIHGRAELEISGSKGTVVDLGWDERLHQATGRPLPFPGSLHPQWNQVDSWILDGTTRSIRTIDSRAGRYLLLAVWGESIVDIALRVTEERYPVKQLGYFDSSNDLLDRIWQVGVDTAYPNMTDAYADPWRERGQWWGDAYVIDHVNRVAFGDSELLRRGLLLMADAFENGKPEAMAPNGEGLNMIDYAMLWVHSLQEYLLMTDDKEFAWSLYPLIVDFLTYLEGMENPSSGLLELPKDIWARSIYIDPLAGSARKGQSAPANAFYAETLRRVAHIAETLGDQERANVWTNRSEQVKQKTNDLLYLPDQEQYLTSIYEGQLITPTLYAQAWPLAYDLVSPENVPGVVDAFQEMLIPDPTNSNIGVYGMYWVLEGYGRFGYITDAIATIENYYGWMLDNGATTWWEGFNNWDYRGSLSHGWGGSPTWFLTTYVLGTQQTGVHTWQVKPSFIGVDYVSGALPLVDGLLDVHWEGKACQNRSLNLESPLATVGTVIISDSLNTTIFWNDHMIWSLGEQHHVDVNVVGADIHITVPGGEHHFEINDNCSKP